jgi:hypothetical protein
VGKEVRKSKPVKEQKKLCPLCKEMAPWYGPKYNLDDMEYHLNTHSKDALIFLITEDLLKMKT